MQAPQTEPFATVLRKLVTPPTLLCHNATPPQPDRSTRVHALQFTSPTQNIVLPVATNPCTSAHPSHYQGAFRLHTCVCNPCEIAQPGSPSHGGVPLTAPASRPARQQAVAAIHPRAQHPCKQLVRPQTALHTGNNQEVPLTLTQSLARPVPPIRAFRQALQSYEHH